jgi:hypothetical protein
MEKKEKKMACHQMRHAGIFMGILLVALGSLGLLAEMHMLDDITRYWPLALIALGIVQLFGRARQLPRARRPDGGENRYGPANY